MIELNQKSYNQIFSNYVSEPQISKTEIVKKYFISLITCPQDK